MSRPVLFVLAGVNGAGKSSVGGFLLQRQGLAWFNPDTFASELRTRCGCTNERASSLAWKEGLRRLDDATRQRHNHAFETTLGGQTITGRLHQAAATHDVVMWFCGLATPELHVARVLRRVAAGGHPIDEALILQRWQTSIRHLIELLPVLASLQVYDNSAEADGDGVVPDPNLVLQCERRIVVTPDPTDAVALDRVPSWARAVVEAAFRMQEPRCS